MTGSGQHDTEDDDNRDITDDKHVTNDAETNTPAAEPIVLTCSVCSHKVNSAWSLMQHIQVPAYHAN